MRLNHCNKFQLYQREKAFKNKLESTLFVPDVERTITGEMKVVTKNKVV